MSKAQIYPDFQRDDLQFQRILKEIQQYALSPIAVERIKKISPITHLESIKKFLKQTEECMQSIALDAALNIHQLDDILPYMSRLKIQNYILPPEHLLEIISLLRHRIHAKTILSDKHWTESFPSLASFIDGPFPPEELMNFIDEKYDERGELRENASPELVRLSRAINAKQAEIDKNFKTIVTKYREKGILHETEESIRNGRRVITVDAGHKRQIQGIFHDESSSGKTIYIEPGEIIPLNNELFNLYNNVEKEKKRLLRLTAEKIRNIADELPEYQRIMSWYEVIYAKAKYALSIDAHIPEISDTSRIDIVNGRHPLLYVKNREENKKTVPFSLKLEKKKRILMVSGPNAGGKSILLKSVGLLQLMLQAGIPVPADRSSEFGIFHRFFIDIGDQQSVEDDLSTYSSHLSNMKTALKKTNSRSLILFDEFGTGTDPQMGGPIAESILNQLMKKPIYGVITSHYGNLKAFASSHKNIVNGALLFDDSQLVPTYQLKVGKPGSSYAYEIAKNIGLPPHIIKHAQKIAGTEVSSVEDLLTKLQQDKIQLEKQALEIQQREKEIDILTKTYDHLQAELEVRRKRMKMEAKENALQYVLKQKKELNSLINAVKKERDLRKAEKLKNILTEKQGKIVKDIRKMEEEVLRTDETSGEIEVGSFVKMRKGEGLTGKVERIKGKIAQVVFGNLRMEVRLRDLKLINKTINVRSNTSQLDYNRDVKVKSKIDIRGLDRKEATDLLEAFLDKAIIADLHEVEIIHGKGTGALRKITKEICRQYKDVKEISHPPDERGGLGKSIITFGE